MGVAFFFLVKGATSLTDNTVLSEVGMPPHSELIYSTISVLVDTFCFLPIAEWIESISTEIQHWVNIIGRRKWFVSRADDFDDGIEWDRIWGSKSNGIFETLETFATLHGFFYYLAGVQFISEMEEWKVWMDEWVDGMKEELMDNRRIPNGNMMCVLVEWYALMNEYLRDVAKRRFFFGKTKVAI